MYFWICVSFFFSVSLTVFEAESGNLKHIYFVWFKPIKSVKALQKQLLSPSNLRVYSANGCGALNILTQKLNVLYSIHVVRPVRGS